MEKHLEVSVVGIFFDPHTMELKATLQLRLDQQRYSREINVTEFFRNRKEDKQK